MRKEQNVEKLFRESFSNFEADVNPSVWSNIEQGLPAQNIPGSSPAGKTSGFFGKVTLNTIVLVAALSAIIIGTTIYFSTQKPVAKDVLAQNVKAEPQQAQNNSAATTQTEPAAFANTVDQPKKSAAPKQSAAKAEQKVYLNEPPKQAPAEAKTEKKPDVNANSMQVAPVETKIEPVQGQESTTAAATNKITTSFHRSSEPETPKNFTPPAGETSPVTNGPLNSEVPAEESLASESTETFHFYIPNVFTPNGDYVNDYFTPIGNSIVKDYELIIYDRYGFEIFRSTDITAYWDGRLRDGNIAAQAVYVYAIRLTDFKGEAHEYMGYVALIK